MADKLAEIRERLAKATPGPWFWNSYADVHALIGDEKHPLNIAFPDERPMANICRSGQPKGFRGDDVGLACVEAGANMDLIAHAPTDLAYLLARLEAAEKTIVLGEQVIPSDCHTVDPQDDDHDETCVMCHYRTALTTWHHQREGGG